MLPSLLTLLVVLPSALVNGEEIACGYPGSPANGRPLSYNSVYRPGQEVSFQCDRGYQLLPPTSTSRRCQRNGTWSGPLPLCAMLERPTGPAESSDQSLRYTPLRATDGQLGTCAHVHGALPRWWRVQLGRLQHVVAVVITFPTPAGYGLEPPPPWAVPTGQYVSAPSRGQYISFTVELLQDRRGLAHYVNCASYNRVIQSPTVILFCSDGGAPANFIHIADKNTYTSSFGLCEVQIIVKKDFHSCGQPEQPAQSFVASRTEDQVRFECIYGYVLVGSKDGVRVCDKNTGIWKGSQPVCRFVDCGPPLLGNGTAVNLLNGTTVYGSMAQVDCESHSTEIQCLRNGSWSNVDCRRDVPSPIPDLAGNEIQEMVKDNTHHQPSEEGSPLSTGLIAGISVAVLFLLLLVALFILLYRRWDDVSQGAVNICLAWKRGPPPPPAVDVLAMYAKVNYDKKRKARLQRELSTYQQQGSHLYGGNFDIWKENDIYDKPHLNPTV